MKNLLISALLIFASIQANAVYNSNMKGVIKNLMVYADSDHIYLVLTNQPKVHPACKPNYFVIPATVTPGRRQMMLSRLLAAYAAKENVNIGYDGTGDCADGYIRVHRAR